MPLQYCYKPMSCSQSHVSFVDLLESAATILEEQSDARSTKQLPMQSVATPKVVQMIEDLESGSSSSQEGWLYLIIC